MKAIFLSFGDFSGGFECVLIQLLLIQTLSACNFISEGRPAYPLSGDMNILCGVNRFRVMIDFLRNGSTYPAFCKTFRFSGLNGGHV